MNRCFRLPQINLLIWAMHRVASGCASGSNFVVENVCSQFSDPPSYLVSDTLVDRNAVFYLCLQRKRQYILAGIVMQICGY